MTNSDNKIGKFKFYHVIKLGIITILLIIVLSIVFGVKESNAESKSGNFIKIGLQFGNNAKNAMLESPDGLTLYGVKNDTIIPIRDLKGCKKVVLTLSKNGVSINDGQGKYIANMATDGSQIIASSTYILDNGYFIFNGKKYRGGIMPYINAARQMNIVDYIDIEDYVKGVVSAEIGLGTNMEALKAQAVATRSYAYANLGIHRSQGFDLCSTGHCQVYSGVSAEYYVTNKAVNDTTGQMIYYDGKPVASFYFANSGGYTENSEDVWSSKLGYLKSIKDEFSPEYNWEIKLTQAQLNKVFASKGIGKIIEVKVDSVNPSGYVSSLTVTGSKGSTTVKKDSIRWMFRPIVSLKSRLFSISSNGGIVTGKIDKTKLERAYYVSNGKNNVQFSTFINVRSNIDKSLLPLNNLTILGKDSQINIENEVEHIPNMTSVSVKLNKNTDMLIISGRGFGHGVGMSQQGAEEMGKQGYSYIDILKYYYTGVEVK